MPGVAVGDRYGIEPLSCYGIAEWTETVASPDSTGIGPVSCVPEQCHSAPHATEISVDVNCASASQPRIFGQCATLKHMSEVGIRALKQNASAVVAEAAAGETVTITDRGRPVARMSAIPASRLQALIQEGRARPARSRLVDLAPPESGPDVSSALQEMRAGERY